MKTTRSADFSDGTRTTIAAVVAALGSYYLLGSKNTYCSGVIERAAMQS
jgi:hypothetical protein